MAPVKIDGTEVIKFHGTLIFLSPGSPTAGNRGSTVNHVGLGAQDVRKLFAKLQANGVKVDPTTLHKSPVNDQYLFDLNRPDGVMIEITEESARKEMQAWYAKMFGGEPSERRGEYIVGFPGVKFFRIAPCGSEYSACPASGSAPTKGRALDHIGFEVKDLNAFCKKLEANGVKLDQPYSKSRHKSYASAELMDPWGTSIELTEGLNRF